MDAVSMSFLRSITLQHLLLFTNQDVLWIPLVTVFNGSFKIWVWLVKSLVSSVQFLSHVCLYVTPWITACQAFLSITNSWSLLRLMSIESVMPSNHLILCHPFVLPPSIFSSIRVFSNESFLCIRWPKYWSFSISLPMNTKFWFLLGLTSWISVPIQGTLKSLLQHHISKVIGHWWLTQSPAGFPYLEVGGWGWKFHPYNHLMDSSYSQFSILAGLPEVTLLTNSGVVERDLIWITKDSPLIFIAVKIY